ncbi:MAG: hypothetical protein DMD52_02690 [Gemmatimonadetes bacterium]|nr:MAG: hypothetical protein DMD52_02690 [Gemmatimonadota bacterium]
MPLTNECGKGDRNAMRYTGTQRYRRVSAGLALLSVLGLATCEKPLPTSGSTTVPVASVAVSPPSLSVGAGTTGQLTATPKDANGAALSGRVVTWASSNSAAATVNGSGMVTGVAVGAATITATSEGQNGTASVAVTPPPVALVSVSPASATIAAGNTVQLAVTLQDANGNPLSGRVVTWRSSNTAAATVSGSGLVSGVAAGSATITAASEGKSATATITVSAVSVASVTVSPATANVNEGSTVQLTATPKDANGVPLTGRTVTWASDNTTVATVSATGLVTGKVAGSATITATSEGQGGTAAITVVHVPVASVAVSPAPASVQAGQTVQLTATPKDASGTPLAGRTVTWASDNTAVATVSGSGLVSGVAAGSATITATSEGQSGTSALTVSAAPPPGTCVTSVVAVHNTAFATQSGSFTVQFDATPNGSPIDAPTGLSSGPAAGYTDLAVIVRFNPTGQIDARNGGAYAAASTIQYAAGTSYHFRLVVDVASRTYSAYVTPAGGTELTIGTGFAFRSEQSGVTALANWALGAGVGSHTVCNFAITSSTPPAPVASVTVTPPTPSVSVGATVQLIATPKDANGNPLAGRVVTWASGNTAVATVSGSGLVTGVAAGSATITATSEGQSGTASVTVIFVPVAAVIVSPPSPSVQAGFTVQLTATPEDANGAPLSGRTVTWSSDNTAVATVNGSGLVTAVAAGSATITATSEGKSGTAAVTVTPAPPPGSSVVLVGAGDIGNCSSNETATTALLAGIAGTVFTAGDNAYPGGSTSDYMSCYDPYWGKEKARTRPAPGNHEYNDDHSSSAPGYYNYFGRIVGDSAKYWYSYDIGAWHIVVINTWIDMSVGSPQETWLRADLAASTKRCTLAYMHYPRFSSGANHGSYSSVQPIWQALYDNGAEIAIAGHDHEYERFAPQTPTGQSDVAKGIRSFVVGTGGAGLYSFSTPLPNSEVRNASTFGVIKLTLSDQSYTWEFIPIAGQTFTDSGSGTCH